MREYLGIQYVDFGRTKEGLDCWGLCYLIAKEKFNYELPVFSNHYASASDGESVSDLVESEKLKQWDKIDINKYEEGDIIVFRVAGFPCHVGTFIGKNKFIHILKGSEVTIESLDSIVWRNRIDGVYRRCKTM